MIYDAIDYRLLTATPAHKRERPALPTRRCSGCGYHVAGPCAVCDQGAAVRYCAPRDLLTYTDVRAEMLRPKGKEILAAAVAWVQANPTRLLDLDAVEHSGFPYSKSHIHREIGPVSDLNRLARAIAFPASPRTPDRQHPWGAHQPTGGTHASA